MKKNLEEEIKTLMHIAEENLHVFMDIYGFTQLVLLRANCIPSTVLFQDKIICFQL